MGKTRRHTKKTKRKAHTHTTKKRTNRKHRTRHTRKMNGAGLSIRRRWKERKERKKTKKNKQRNNSNTKEASPEFPPRPLSAHDYNVDKDLNPRKEPSYASIASLSSPHYANPDSLKSSFKTADINFNKPRMPTPKRKNSGPYVRPSEVRRRKYENYGEESF